MTDASLRTLERAWRASPTVEAEADYLRARVRAGDLAPEKLELAAYVGHAAARKAAGHGCCPRHQALGRDPQEGALARLLCSESPLAVHDPLPAWVRGLSRWGAEAQVRAAVAAGWEAQLRTCRDHWESADACEVCEEHPPEQAEERCPVLGPPRRALEAAEAWLACPCEEHLAAWAEAWHACDWEQAQWLPWVSCDTYPQPGGKLEPGDQSQHVQRAARLATPGAVRTAIQQALTAWALG